jgi:prevent-host-death family protein
MKSREDIRPISYVKANAAEILSQVNETQRPIYITQNGEAKAVLLDPESYDRMRQALGLLKLLDQGEKDASEGRTIPQEELFAELDKRLGIKGP